ncbi:hypothetical protein V6N13_038341 [Hibiscus sabdariffa]
MASPVWFITLFISYVSLGAGVGFVSTLASGLVTSATASPLEDEAEALLHTGWWSWYSNDTSKHCKWPDLKVQNLSSTVNQCLEMNLPVKRLSASPACPRCLLEPESAIHAVRDWRSRTNPTESPCPDRYRATACKFVPDIFAAEAAVCIQAL